MTAHYSMTTHHSGMSHLTRNSTRAPRVRSSRAIACWRTCKTYAHTTNLGKEPAPVGPPLSDGTTVVLPELFGFTTVDGCCGGCCCCCCCCCCDCVCCCCC
ncbi:hypothetical protein PUN28_014105 [Cardiocondyla obscurior]|uniref:Cysteine-rich transmembrane CYSTM domain-containing protein n=1 Tax=Cardiocondyla obscurior TaxID=286306 RepID=A0AAW2F032_9HYME